MNRRYQARSHVSMSSPRDLRLRLCRYDGSRGSPEPSASPPTRQCLRRDLRLEGLADIFDIISDFGNASEFGLKGLPTTSASPLLWLEGLTATFGCYFNLYVIYLDYFHYTRSLSHEHQPRGAGGVLEDPFILDDEVLSGARVRRLEDVAAPFGHGNADCIGSRSRGYHGGVLEDQFTLEDGALPEAQRRSHLLVEAQKRSYLRNQIPEDLRLALV